MARLLALLLFLAPTAAFAQDPAIRWGQISDAEIAMREVPDDPDASAIVLGDVGFDEVETGGRDVRYSRRRHRRVKVLTEAGYEQGEVSLRYPKGSRLRGIKGQTFVPQSDGTVRRVELEGQSVFREEVRDGLFEVRFTMPALTPGAIFEIEYTFESDNFINLPPWYFQADQPTVVSEYRASLPGSFEYVTITQGTIEDYPTGRGHSAGGLTSEARWTARDLPALRDEPYTTTEDDYATRIELQLQQVRLPNGMPQRVLTTWEEVAEALESHEAFGRRLATSRLRRSTAAQATGSPDARARALYDLVRTGYVSNGRGGIFADRDLNDVIETKSGTDAELTLLLAALLREADVPARLAILSTRPNGRPTEIYPLVNQFDRVSVLVEHEDGSFAYLDPTDRNRPYGVLPVTSLNGRAWLVDPRDPRWVNVPATAGTATTSLVEAALAPDGQLVGTLELRLKGYDAEHARDEMTAAAADAPARAAADAEAIAEAADASEGFEVETVEVVGLDSVDEALEIKATFAAHAGEAVADEIYLTPFVLMQLDENPFERPTRTFPVDFAYPSTRTYVASIALPEGYAPDEIPTPVRMTTPSRSVSYQRFVGVEDGRLLVRAVLSIGQSQVSAAEYPSLRKLYEEIVAAEAEAIVLVRSKASAEEAPVEPTPEGSPGEGQ